MVSCNWYSIQISFLHSLWKWLVNHLADVVNRKTSLSLVFKLPLSKKKNGLQISSSYVPSSLLIWSKHIQIPAQLSSAQGLLQLGTSWHAPSLQLKWGCYWEQSTLRLIGFSLLTPATQTLPHSRFIICSMETFGDRVWRNDSALVPSVTFSSLNFFFFFLIWYTGLDSA